MATLFSLHLPKAPTAFVPPKQQPVSLRRHNMAKSVLDIATMNTVIDELQSLTSTEKEELKNLTNELISTIENAELALHDPTARTRLVQVQDELSNLYELVEKPAAVETSQTKSRFPTIEPLSRIKKLMETPVVVAKPSLPWKNMQDAGVTGREEEKKKITEQLLSSTNITVLPIVGIRGIGKTTLAKFVYDNVNPPFWLKVWVDGGESFNRESIEKSIIGKEELAQLVDDNVNPPFEFKFRRGEISLESIKKLIIEKANESEANGQRRYLVVLEDVESADPEEWCEFKKDLPPGGSILITTRSVLVARITGTVPPVGLHGLSEDDSWSLFTKIVSSSDQSDSRNLEVGRKMVEKCQGVPLAIKVIRGLWLTSPDSEKNIESMEKKFIQELELIYCSELAFPLKLCFAFCSLFPNNDAIEVPRLINLWIGERFIIPRFSSSQRLEYEAVGEEYFQDLYGRSILQDVQEDELGNPTSCRMHPLMHYLALMVARDENISVHPDGKGDKSKVRHASFDFSLAVSSEIPESLYEKAGGLLTILLPAAKQSWLPNEMMSTSTLKKILIKFKILRVLDLHDLGIKTVPSSIGYLDLRYLDLSRNSMEKLPHSITNLVHLQTLRLSHCRKLNELPKDLDKLTKLRHLEIDGCLNLPHMPKCMKNMTSLRTLSLFVGSRRRSSSIQIPDPHTRGSRQLGMFRTLTKFLGSSSSSSSNQSDRGGLTELAALKSLRGVLEIAHLERCSESDAEEAKLQEKHDLQRLILRWDHSDKDSVNDSETNFLKMLKPPKNLKFLFLTGYEGTTLSHELPMSSLQHLVKFSLYNCRKCESLSILHTLQSMEILELQKLDSLKFVVDKSEEDARSQAKYFPSLKKLKISDCPVLKSWWENDEIPLDSRPSFPSISILDIRYCPELACMPLFVDLDEKLVVVSSSVKPLQDTLEKSSSRSPFKLKSMLIANMNNEKPPPEQWLRNFTSLQCLHIRECHHLKSLPEGFQHLTSLQNLIIENCKELDLTKHFTNLKSLRTLTIRGIPNLKSLPNALPKVTTLRLHDCSQLLRLINIRKFTDLETLVITECHKLGSLPKNMKDLKSLHTLTIKDCPKLVPRCRPETGDNWPQIKRVKNISVT